MKIIQWKDIEKNDTDKLVKEATERINKKIDEISEKIRNQKDIKLIFICGPSASGKTTFAGLLEEKLDSMGIESHTLSLDDFFKNREDLPYIKEGLKDFDSVHALDIELIKQCFIELLSRHMSYIPQFDFMKGVRRDEKRLLKIDANDVVIIEGIHSFNPLIQGDIEGKHFLNIYIEPMSDIEMPDGNIMSGKDVRLIRRMIRDLYTRGHSLDATIMQWYYVRQSEDVNIYPHKDKADYHIDTLAEYEPMIYKKLILSAFNEDVVKYGKFINFLKDIREESPDIVPDNSIIKEFTKFSK